MKYKILLTGKNNSTIDDFFTQLDDNFEILTTSGRVEDITNHLKYFKPNIFVYCLSRNMHKSFNSLIPLKNQLEKKNIPFVIIGTEEDCNSFLQYAVNIADLVLVKPITASAIMNNILDYLNTRQQGKEEAERAEKERLAQEAAELAEKERLALEKAERAKKERLALEKAERAKKERLAQEKASHKKHILVVDDDPLMLKVLREHLHEKYEVATANSGKIALKFLEKKKTDLILLDYEMPIEDGPTILKKLHANDVTKDIPVVFLTGIVEYDKIQKAMVQKPQGYLLKPVDHKKLFEVISKLIG